MRNLQKFNMFLPPLPLGAAKSYPMSPAHGLALDLDIVQRIRAVHLGGIGCVGGRKHDAGGAFIHPLQRSLITNPDSGDLAVFSIILSVTAHVFAKPIA